MARRRSRIRQAILRALHSGRPDDYLIVYIDRDQEGRARAARLPAARVAAVSEWAMLLDDGDTVIPLHRVIEVRTRDGRVVWTRRPRGG